VVEAKPKGTEDELLKLFEINAGDAVKEQCGTPQKDDKKMTSGQADMLYLGIRQAAKELGREP
jgi:hypothetical protein